jgi:GT2 family glycosyltransferase
MSAPLVSVIILGWGGEPYIAQCLNALLQQTYPRIEIIVVDNASSDGTAAIVARDFPQVKLVHTPTNLGVAGGNNTGFRTAAGDILVLTNVDTKASPNWIEVLVQAMLSDPTIGIASSKLLYPEGTIQYGGGIVDPRQGFARHGAAGEKNVSDSQIRDIDFATGASLAIRRAALEQIGLEDEAYFPIDYEDSDLSYRARQAGWRVVYVPDAVSTHYESSTVKSLAPHRVLSSQVGRLRFIAKFWSDEQLIGAFLPAETRWLAELNGSKEGTGQFLATAMPLVYFKTLLDLDDLVAWRIRLGVGDADSSRATLMSVLTQLRAACLQQTSPNNADTAQTRMAVAAVRQALKVWLPEEHSGAGDAVLLSMQTAELRVNPHIPIAWPAWPPGIWPKLQAVIQKVTRRLLRWYINPLVAQQNDINASLLQSMQMLSQEILLLRMQIVAQDQALGDRIETLGQTPGTTPQNGDDAPPCRKSV